MADWTTLVYNVPIRDLSRLFQIAATKTKTRRVFSRQLQSSVLAQKGRCLVEFLIHLNTVFDTPEPARHELMSIVRRSIRHLGEAIADVVVAKKTRQAVGHYTNKEANEVAAAAVILG